MSLLCLGIELAQFFFRFSLKMCLISFIDSGMERSTLFFLVAVLAVVSAFSFPGMPQWPGSHTKLTIFPWLRILIKVCRMSQTILFCGKGLLISWRALRQSLKMQEWRGLVSSIHSRAKRIAMSSALKIEIKTPKSQNDPHPS